MTQIVNSVESDGSANLKVEDDFGNEHRVHVTEQSDGWMVSHIILPVRKFDGLHFQNAIDARDAALEWLQEQGRDIGTERVTIDSFVLPSPENTSEDAAEVAVKNPA